MSHWPAEYLLFIYCCFWPIPAIDDKAEFRQLGIMARKQTFNEGSMGGSDGQPDCSDSSTRRFAADFTLFGKN
jgi:hypothetical protein